MITGILRVSVVFGVCVKQCFIGTNLLVKNYAIIIEHLTRKAYLFHLKSCSAKWKREHRHLVRCLKLTCHRARYIDTCLKKSLIL
jgi:hypothetical protein